ncbi:MAG: MerR family transcriptional regulator [Deltaproteobacteria bacterium]|nr:MerR family transcriptional regulator [Candidatus Anaeroferrophillus wilburensis]MBN2889713.1 MerR family transcriptional regulator [Deltaproteobacteria bacterium]
MDAGRIPNKLFFRIGEVSDIVNVKPYVLRYWESEFELVSPEKSNSKQRLYQRKDLELLLEIKRLLYDEGFTVAGARKKLNQLKQHKKIPPPCPDLLAGVKEGLEQLKELLQSR